jgi:hypothetical protein
MERPRRMTLAYVDDGASAKWISTASIPGIRRRDAGRMFPWLAYEPDQFAAPAPRLPIPSVTVTREGTAIRVRSQRNADRVSLIIHRKVASLRVNGVVPAPRPLRFRDYIAPGWTRVGSRGSEIVVDVGSAEPVEIYAGDATIGLPPEGRPFTAARSASMGVTSDGGDSTITVRHTKL